MTAEKVLENRLRRVAERRGLRLVKSRRRDPMAIDFGGYMLIDLQTNAVILGADPVGFSATLDDVKAYFSEPRRRTGSSGRQLLAKNRGGKTGPSASGRGGKNDPNVRRGREK
jgi:hypothetical protein